MLLNNSYFMKGKKMRFNTESKSFKLFQALEKGESLTGAQISQRFGIKNPRATVSDLRLNHGIAVYANESVDSKGRKTTKYRVGTPTRRVVAAGYRALAMGLV
jgi:hypothetical protein